MVLNLIAAAIGAGTALYSGAQQANAAQRAGQAQTFATNQAVGMQRDAAAGATAALSPYVTEGNAARSGYNALLGIPTARPTQAGESRTPWEAYLDNYTDVAAEAQKEAANPKSRFYGDAGAYAQWHWENYGKAEGRTDPAALLEKSIADYGGATNGDVSADRAKAYQDFEASPYAAAGNYGAQEAEKSFLSLAGNSGNVLSGRTVRGLSEINTGYKKNALLEFMGALNGVADRGYDASRGIAGAGQTFANNAGALLTGGAANSGNALLAGADARAGGLQDAAAFLAYGLGQYGNPKPQGQTPGTTARAAGSYFGRTQTQPMVVNPIMGRATSYPGR